MCSVGVHVCNVYVCGVHVCNVHVCVLICVCMHVRGKRIGRSHVTKDDQLTYYEATA